MNCREYIFKLSSGQLQEEASASDQMGAALHRLICRPCRSFTHNDAALSNILSGYRTHLEQPDAAADRAPGDDPA